MNEKLMEKYEAILSRHNIKGMLSGGAYEMLTNVLNMVYIEGELAGINKAKEIVAGTELIKH